jgi:hypothetical protein
MPTARRAKRPFKLHAFALMLVSTGLAAQTATCDNSTIYLSQGNPGAVTELQTSPGTLPVSFTTAGASATRTYNALGRDPLTGNLFGTTANGNVLVQVNPGTGATTDLGAIQGLPGSVERFNSGAFSADGKYYVKPFGDNSELYRIDVAASPPTATLITLSQTFTTSDMAWSGSLMYSTADNGQLYSIDVATGVTTPIGAPDTTGGVLGAQFSSTNGLFGAANNGSGMYRINLGTGQRDKISNAPASGNNDGASCSNAALFESLSPEPQPPTAVPTLDIAGLGLLSLLGAGAGALALRRRKRAG